MVGIETAVSGRTMVSSRAHQLLMQEEGKEVILPDDLVERILSMVAFPAVFKFRVLSKSWRARLSSIPPEDDDGKNRLTLSFQRQLTQRSIHWKTFCPVDLSDNGPDCVAFDRTSNTWLRIPLPSSLQQKLPVRPVSHHAIPRESPGRGGDLRMEGALLLLPVSRNELFVANILTRSWKQLPPCPHQTDLEGTLLSSHKSETYKVFVMPGVRDDHNFLQIYDSTSAAWTTLTLPLSLRLSRWEPVANLDGVLYLVTGRSFRQAVDPRRVSHEVLSIEIKENVLQVDTLAQDFNIVAELDLTGKKLESVNKVICEPNLLIIFLFLTTYFTGHQILRAVHIDLETGLLLRVTECPVPCPPTIGQAPVANRITDCDDIIVTVKLGRSQVLTYNVQEDKWIWLHYSGLSHDLARYRGKFHERSIRSDFRPGLNPFAAV